MGAFRHLDGRNLPAALSGIRGPVLVDFHATWCGPCRSLAPNLDALADVAGEQLAVIKVDIDQAPAAANAFSVRSVPTLVLLDNGRIQDVRVGLQSLAQLRAWVGGVLQPTAKARP